MTNRSLSFLVVKILLLVLLTNWFAAVCQKNQIVKAANNNKIAVANMPRRLMKTVTAKPKKAKFYAALSIVLKNRGLIIENLYDSRDQVARRVLEDYGAVFLAAENVLPPPVCMFVSEKAVEDFQKKAGIAAAEIDGVTIELQPAALAALLAAREEALRKNLDVTPRDGVEAARRNFADTVRLWNSRFLPALAHWQELGRLTHTDAQRLAALPINDQVREVLELEQRGLFFNTFFNNSILYSVAAPGASQHLSLLAFDANEFANERVRKILAKHGWFRTVRGDAPHFTYLGVDEDLLPSLGLKQIKTDAGKYWIPNVDAAKGKKKLNS